MSEDPKEIDFITASGLRIRTMDILVDDSAMILDRDGEMISLFDPRRREWRGGELGDAPQLVLSHSIATEIARLLAKEDRT